MKKLLVMLLTVAMLFSISVVSVAEEAKAAAPGEGPEKDRPNDSASVIQYFAAAELRKWSFFEAEFAEKLDGARANSDHAGYSGDGCVALTLWGSNKEATPGIKFNVNAAIEGAQDLYIGYNNGHAFAQSANLTVNGTTTKIYFPTIKKDAWASYAMIKTPVTLNAGANEVIIQLDKADYPSSYNIDFVAVSKGDTWKDEAKAIKLQIGNTTITKVTENGEVPVTFDVAPVISDSRTFIPVRGMFELAGAKIGWNPDTREVTVEADGTTVVVTIDSRQARVNGKRNVLDAAPFIKDGRTLIPVRFISENLGYKVDWNADTQEITINLYE